jgi:hypothetical protein
MSKPSFFTFIFAGLLAFGILLGSTLPVAAARGVYKAPTVITITKLPGINLGEPFILSGFIKTEAGAPVANKSIGFTINGRSLGQARSNSKGYFQRKFTNNPLAGTYTIIASTTATHYLLGTSTSTTLEISPVDVRIQTVPAIPGVTFKMAGQEFVSGEDGVANISIGYVGKYQLSVLVNQYVNPDQRIEFARWTDETYKPTQLVQVPTNKVIEVGFNVYQKVGQSFVDLAGYPVPSERIKQFTIKSAQGDVFVLKDGQPRWLPASRIARRQSGLEATPLMYSVISMMVDGANVVNQSQQQFYAHPNDTWQISLILYSLSVRANDGLFGSSVGKSVDLVYPDGHTKNYPFNRDGTVAIHALARGNYTVEVMDAKGLRQVIPVALSRSQTVDIKVPTTLDLLVASSSIFLVALGLFLFGRRQHLGSMIRRNRPVYLGAQNFLVKSGEHKKPEKKVSLTNNAFIKWS